MFLGFVFCFLWSFLEVSERFKCFKRSGYCTNCCASLFEAGYFYNEPLKVLFV